MRENQLLLKDLLEHLKTKIYKYMTLVSENVYIDKLDDTVGESNNTYHRTIKMIHILIFKKKFMKKILNLKLVIS